MITNLITKQRLPLSYFLLVGLATNPVNPHLNPTLIDSSPVSTAEPIFFEDFVTPRGVSTTITWKIEPKKRRSYETTSVGLRRTLKMARMAEKGAKSGPQIIKNQFRRIKIPGNPDGRGASVSQKQLRPWSAHRCFPFLHHFGSRLPLITQQRITNEVKSSLERIITCSPSSHAAHPGLRLGFFRLSVFRIKNNTPQCNEIITMKLYKNQPQRK